MDTKAKIRPAGAEWIMDEIKAGMDADEWGSAMGWFFAVAHVLYHHTAEPIPSVWGYGHPDLSWCSPSIKSDDYQEATIMDYWPSLVAMTPEGTNPDWHVGQVLMYVGNVLDRYVRALDRAGWSY